MSSHTLWSITTGCMSSHTVFSLLSRMSLQNSLIVFFVFRKLLIGLRWSWFLGGRGIAGWAGAAPGKGGGGGAPPQGGGGGGGGTPPAPSSFFSSSSSRRSEKSISQITRGRMLFASIFSHWASPSRSSGSGDAAAIGESVSPRVTFARKAACVLPSIPVNSICCSSSSSVGSLCFARIRFRSRNPTPSTWLVSGSASVVDIFMILYLRDFLCRGALVGTLVRRDVRRRRAASW